MKQLVNVILFTLIPISFFSQTIKEDPKGNENTIEKIILQTEKIDKIINEIERKIREKIKGKEISSIEIGELVMKSLKKLDKVAYIRFASVYRDFKDVNDFKKEIKEVA